ncbi:MAG: RluA family pseudouridine synthase [Bacteroidetes bacterium]|nr:RluA family pseudouridine synthase [Bacteroidota bacterium]
MKQATTFRKLILLETPDLVVVNKPPFVPSIPERGKKTAPSVLEVARYIYGDALPCHRIDRETSGALIIALNAETHRHINIQFEKREVTKLYHAVVEGQVQFDAFVVDLPIQADDLNHIHIDKKHGKPAVTEFQTLKLFRHFSLVECKPHTGRQHQIRVHLASQNAKIAGDVLYGGQFHTLQEIKRNAKGETNYLMQRFALHARALEFSLPDGSRVHVEAPYPKDMEVFLKLLEKYDHL